MPRPGSLVADVRLSARAPAGGSGGHRRAVRHRVVAVRGGRRATVRVRARRAGAYEIAVRAGASRATLGPAVVARVVVG